MKIFSVIGRPIWWLKRISIKMCVSLVPISLHFFISKYRGKLYSLLGPPPNYVLQNIAAAFPDYEANEVRRIGIKYIQFKRQIYMWRILPLHPQFQAKACESPWLRVSVFEHFVHGSQGGNGIILLTAHFGFPHIIPRALELYGFRVRQLLAKLDRPEQNERRERSLASLSPLKRRIFTKTQLRVDKLGSDDIVAGLDVRPILAALASGGIVMIAGDGFRSTQYISLKFMSHDYPFPTGFVKIALATGASLVPVFAILHDTPSCIEVEFHQPIEGDSLQGNIGLFRDVLEKQIVRFPHLYQRWGAENWFEQANVRGSMASF